MGSGGVGGTVVGLSRRRGLEGHGVSDGQGDVADGGDAEDAGLVDAGSRQPDAEESGGGAASIDSLTGERARRVKRKWGFSAHFLGLGRGCSSKGHISGKRLSGTGCTGCTIKTILVDMFPSDIYK